MTAAPQITMKTLRVFSIPKENLKVFDAEDFIAEVSQHIPLPRVRLVRYYGLYSSCSKEKWAEMDYVAKHGPEGLKQSHGERGKEEEPVPEQAAHAVLPAKKAGSVWAKLISKIYEVDPFVCPRWGHDMKIMDSF